MANTKVKRHGGFGGCCVYGGDNTNYGPAGGWVTLSSGGVGYGGFGGGGTSFGWGKMSGGINLSGSVWSNQSGWVTISYGGSSVEVYMTQGWNDINVWIPTLSPVDKFVESNIEIDTNGGYILIPAGFKIKFTQSPKAPPVLEKPKPVDKIIIKDILKYRLVKGSEVHNIAETEDFDIEELFNYIQEKAPQVFDKDIIENIDLEEVFNTVHKIGPRVLHKDIIDDFNIEEVFNTDVVIGPKTIADEDVEETDVDDVFNYRLE